jgi:membrane fusion protein (multidrug efflux system)
MLLHREAPKPEKVTNQSAPTHNRKLYRRLAIVALLMIVVFIGLAYFQFVLKPELIKTAVLKTAPPPITITAEPARTEHWVGQIKAIGTLTAIKGVDVASQVTGIVAAIKFESGDTVAANATLVQLDDAVEQADLASGQATLKQAELDFVRQQKLAAKDFASEATFEEARAKRDTAAAAVERSQALISQKNIKAPFAGRLGIRKVNVGQFVSAGMALVSLQALDPIYVDFTIPEQDVGRVKVEQTVELTVDAVPGEVFRGTVKVLDARVNSDTRALMVRGRLPNPDRKLLPGMFANVTVLTGAPTDVVTVPRTAIDYSLYGDSVFVVHEAHAGSATVGSSAAATSGPQNRDQLVAERRSVRLGEMRDDRVAIAEGIAAGDEVVTSGQLKLQPGVHVRIDNSASLRPPAERPRQ